MVCPGVERDEPSGDGWKGCWTLVLMILGRTRGREAHVSRSKKEKVASAWLARMKPSAVTLVRGYTSEVRVRGGAAAAAEGEKIPLVAPFGGNDPANKA